MPQTYGVPPSMSAAPPPATTSTPNTSRPGSGGVVMNAMMRGAPAPGAPRIPGELLQGLPPEFVDALFEIAQLVDLDGDGTPDLAMVPLNQVGANAMSNPMLGGGQTPPVAGQNPPASRWPSSVP